MQRYRTARAFIYSRANCSSSTASASAVPLLPKRGFLDSASFSRFGATKGRPSLSSGCSNRILFLHGNMSTSASAFPVKDQRVSENVVEQIGLFSGIEDSYGGVIVDMKEPMDSDVFIPVLRASISQWRQQGKKGVWIKLPIELVSLVEPTVQEGFRYHHAEPNYLMLVYWIPNTPDTIPINASHRVGIGAFLMNNKREVLVVQEKSGGFKNSGVWKLPTGVVNEGEHICEAAVREVKEETGIVAEFVEVLAFRQSHMSFFSKSDLFFVCMLRPLTYDIQKQDSEVESVEWMPIEEFVNQSFNRKHEIFRYVAEICKTKSERDYVGFSAVPAATASGKKTSLYFNNRDFSIQ